MQTVAQQETFLFPFKNEHLHLVSRILHDAHFFCQLSSKKFIVGKSHIFSDFSVHLSMDSIFTYLFTSGLLIDELTPSELHNVFACFSVLVLSGLVFSFTLHVVVADESVVGGAAIPQDCMLVDKLPH